jgi:uncharacterized membrane protein YbhN (UPF0104 family)
MLARPLNSSLCLHLPIASRVLSKQSIEGMKNKIIIILDCLIVLAGIIIAPYFFIEWKGVNFAIDAWTVGATREGNAHFFMMILGIVLILYAVFDVFVFRRTSKNRKIQ